ARLADAARPHAGDNLALKALRGIYRPWQPQTTASDEVRRARLDALAKRHPRVAVQLVLGLLPSSFDGFSATTRRPRHRDWADEIIHDITDEDIHVAFEHSWNLLIDICS